MKSSNYTLSRFCLVIAAALLLGACADVKPLEYTEIHEIPPGPGLLSGEDGKFVLFEY